jgi:hypothetical protein
MLLSLAIFQIFNVGGNDVLNIIEQRKFTGETEKSSNCGKSRIRFTDKNSGFSSVTVTSLQNPKFRTFTIMTHRLGHGLHDTTMPT